MSEQWEYDILADTPPSADPIPSLIEVEARLLGIERRMDLAAEREEQIERKQDALYAEIHAVRLRFDELLTGVMGAMQSNPLLSRLLGGRR